MMSSLSFSKKKYKRTVITAFERYPLLPVIKDKLDLLAVFNDDNPIVLMIDISYSTDGITGFVNLCQSIITYLQGTSPAAEIQPSIDGKTGAIINARRVEIIVWGATAGRISFPVEWRPDDFKWCKRGQTNFSTTVPLTRDIIAKYPEGTQFHHVVVTDGAWHDTGSFVPCFSLTVVLFNYNECKLFETYMDFAETSCSKIQFTVEHKTGVVTVADANITNMNRLMADPVITKLRTCPKEIRKESFRSQVLDLLQGKYFTVQDYGRLLPILNPALDSLDRARPVISLAKPIRQYSTKELETLLQTVGKTKIDLDYVTLANLINNPRAKQCVRLPVAYDPKIAIDLNSDSDDDDADAEEAAARRHANYDAEAAYWGLCLSKKSAAATDDDDHDDKGRSTVSNICCMRVTLTPASARNFISEERVQESALKLPAAAIDELLHAGEPIDIEAAYELQNTAAREQNQQPHQQPQQQQYVYCLLNYAAADDAGDKFIAKMLRYNAHTFARHAGIQLHNKRRILLGLAIAVSLVAHPVEQIARSAVRTIRTMLRSVRLQPFKTALPRITLTALDLLYARVIAGVQFIRDFNAWCPIALGRFLYVAQDLLPENERPQLREFYTAQVKEGADTFFENMPHGVRPILSMNRAVIDQALATRAIKSPERQTPAPAVEDCPPQSGCFFVTALQSYADALFRAPRRMEPDSQPQYQPEQQSQLQQQLQPQQQPQMSYMLREFINADERYRIVYESHWSHHAAMIVVPLPENLNRWRIVTAELADRLRLADNADVRSEVLRSWEVCIGMMYQRFVTIPHEQLTILSDELFDGEFKIDPITGTYDPELQNADEMSKPHNRLFRLCRMMRDLIVNDKLVTPGAISEQIPITYRPDNGAVKYTPLYDTTLWSNLEKLTDMARGIPEVRATYTPVYMNWYAAKTTYDMIQKRFNKLSPTADKYTVAQLNYQLKMITAELARCEQALEASMDSDATSAEESSTEMDTADEAVESSNRFLR